MKCFTLRSDTVTHTELDFNFLRYTTEIISPTALVSPNRVARDPDEDDVMVKDKAKVELRYNGKIVLRARSFKSGCKPSAVTEVTLVSRQEEEGGTCYLQC